MAADLLTASGYFIYNNLLPILLVTIMFFAITIFYALNNIHLEEPKLKTAKVVVLEKMDNLQQQRLIKCMIINIVVIVLKIIVIQI